MRIAFGILIGLVAGLTSAYFLLAPKKADPEPWKTPADEIVSEETLNQEAAQRRADLIESNRSKERIAQLEVNLASAIAAVRQYETAAYLPKISSESVPARGEFPKIVPVTVKDATSFQCGKGLAAKIRNEVANSGRYELSDDKLPRIEVFLTGGTAWKRGDEESGTIVILTTIHTEYAGAPLLVHWLPLGYKSTDFKAAQAAENFLGTLDNTLEQLKTNENKQR